MKSFQEKKVQVWRIRTILIIAFILIAILAARLFQVQVLQYKKYSTLAEKQHLLQKEIPAKRGQVFVKEKDDQKFPIAVNVKRYLIYAVPQRITKDDDLASKISPIIDMPADKIKEMFSDKKKVYVTIKHDLSDEQAKKIEDLNFEGIGLTPEEKRYYPEGSLASHILGFVNNEGKGQYGIEGYFNEQLSGKTGMLETEKDVEGNPIFLDVNSNKPASNGDDIVLTIDRSIQYKVEDILKKGVEKHGADSGSVIVIEPQTGKILAMANYPNFDPNKFGEVENFDIFKNESIASVWEPGSIYKVITMAAGLNEGKVTPDSTYDDTGNVERDGYNIKNSDKSANGTQTMTQVLEKSLNTGAIYVKDKTGNETFYNYLKNFGFGVMTGIELEGEGKGDIKPIENWTEVGFATASFGQGIAITPLQMVTAFGAIANSGKMMKPQIIDEVIHPDGKTEKIEPKMVKQVISPQAASLLGGMMVNVVERGHGTQAGVTGYYIAGKTGTAQIPLPGGQGYDPNHTIGSFAGFGPVENPKFVMLVKIDKPRDVIWAESSAAPIFGEIAQVLLNYYQIPPSR